MEDSSSGRDGAPPVGASDAKGKSRRDFREAPRWPMPSRITAFAVSGMTRPDAVVCSASTALTTIRSSSGLMETDTC